MIKSEILPMAYVLASLFSTAVLRGNENSIILPWILDIYSYKWAHDMNIYNLIYFNNMNFGLIHTFFLPHCEAKTFMSAPWFIIYSTTERHLRCFWLISTKFLLPFMLFIMWSLYSPSCQIIFQYGRTIFYLHVKCLLPWTLIQLLLKFLLFYYILLF